MTSMNLGWEIEIIFSCQLLDEIANKFNAMHSIHEVHEIDVQRKYFPSKLFVLVLTKAMRRTLNWMNFCENFNSMKFEFECSKLSDAQLWRTPSTLPIFVHSVEEMTKKNSIKNAYGMQNLCELRAMLYIQLDAFMRMH